MEKTDYKNYIKNKYLLLNSLHDQIYFLSKKDKNNIESSNIPQNQMNNNIFIQYLHNKNKFFDDKANIINFILQLYHFSKYNENIIFPFLNVCPSFISKSLYRK